MQTQFFTDTADSFKGLSRSCFPCGSGKGEAVDENVFFRYAKGSCFFKDKLCQIKALLCSFGDTVLVKGKSHHGCAVMLYKGQHGFKGLFFTVDRVYYGLARIHTQCGFERLCGGGIKLQGKVGDFKDSIYCQRQHGRFVDPGSPHVHIKDISSAVGLGDSFGADIVKVAVKQRLLHSFFAGWVDTLTDYAGHIQQHGLCSGADRRRADRCTVATFYVFKLCPYGFYKVRGRSATAAEDLHAALCELGHKLCKILGSQVVLACDRVGQACVGFCDKGQACPF